MSFAVHNPENYCPICGQSLSAADEHHCEARALAAIDSRRDGRNVYRAPSVATRFRDGFQHVEIVDDQDDELALICSPHDDARIFHWF